MFSTSNIFAQLLVGLISFVMLASAILPGACSCHPNTASTSRATLSHDCCRKTSTCKLSSLHATSDSCCCRGKQLSLAALVEPTRTNYDSVPQALLKSGFIFASLDFIDFQSHFIQKSISTFPATGSPLYLLHRALLL